MATVHAICVGQNYNLMHANWMCLYSVSFVSFFGISRNYLRTNGQASEKCCCATKYVVQHQNDLSKPPDFNPPTLLSSVNFFFRSTAVPCKLIPEIFMITHLVLFEHNRIKLQANVRAKKKQTRNTVIGVVVIVVANFFSIAFYKKHIDVCFQLNCTEPFLRTVLNLHSNSQHTQSIDFSCYFFLRFATGFIHFWKIFENTREKKRSSTCHIRWVCVCAQKSIEKIWPFCCFSSLLVIRSLVFGGLLLFHLYVCS